MTSMLSPATAVATRTAILTGGRGRLPVLVGFFGFAVTFAGSWVPSYWGDEAASVMSAERSIPSLLGMLRNVDAVHGTYYLFLHFWIQMFGASEVSTRLPSAIAAGAMAAGVFVAGRMLVGRNFGIAAAVVSVALPRTIYFSAEARSYAFSSAIAVWSTVLLLVLLRHPFTSVSRRRLAWIAYAAVSAIGIYTFLYMGLLVLAHGLFVITSRDARHAWRNWARAAALALILASPILVIGFSQRSQIAFLAHRNYATAKSVLQGQWFRNPTLAVACWALMIAAISVAIVRRRRADTRSQLVLLAAPLALVPTLVLLLVNSVTPAYNLRYASFSVPGVALLVTAGIWTLRPRTWHIAALVALALIALPTDIAERGPFAKDGGSDLAEASAIVGAKATAGDAIVFDRTTLPSQRPRVALHLYPADYAGLVDVTVKAPYTSRAQLWDTTYPLADVTARLGGIDRVWALEIISSPDYRQHTDVRTLESLGYVITSTQLVHRTVIYSLTKAVHK